MGRHYVGGDVYRYDLRLCGLRILRRIHGAERLGGWLDSRMCYGGFCRCDAGIGTFGKKIPYTVAFRLCIARQSDLRHGECHPDHGMAELRRCEK